MSNLKRVQINAVIDENLLYFPTKPIHKSAREYLEKELGRFQLDPGYGLKAEVTGLSGDIHLKIYGEEAVSPKYLYFLVGYIAHLGMIREARYWDLENNSGPTAIIVSTSKENVNEGEG